MRHRHNSAGHDGTRAAGGATGSPFQIPRIVSLAESDGLRGRREPKLRRIRFAKNHQPSLLVALDQRTVEISHAIFPDSAAGRSDRSSQILVQVLEDEGHPVEWT